MVVECTDVTRITGTPCTLKSFVLKESTQMHEKSIETVPEDVYELFDPAVDHSVSESNLDDLCRNLKDVLRNRLASQSTLDDSLRFSALGRPDRQLWFDAHPVDGGKEPMTGKTYLKFLYGDVIEQLLLFLVKEAGHVVEAEQLEIEVDGVKGHIDCIIDGVVTDVKSASPFGYKKFENNTITEDDPFGYVDQLAGYAHVLTPGRPAAWLAMDKVGGDICVTPLRSVVIEGHNPEDRIKHQKAVIDLPEPPGLCYEPVPDGGSGNLKLPPPCGYCAHRYRCHPGLRTFLYSTGPRFLTHVANTPKVPEVTN